MTNDGIVWYQIFVRAVLYPYDSRLYQQHISTNKQTHKNANDHDCPPAVVRLPCYTVSSQSEQHLM